MLFFFNDTATTEIYTLSLHDALPIWGRSSGEMCESCGEKHGPTRSSAGARAKIACRSEEHTSELQSRQYLVCRLLLEKKKQDGTAIVGSEHKRRPYCHQWRLIAKTRP